MKKRIKRILYYLVFPFSLLFNFFFVKLYREFKSFVCTDAISFSFRKKLGYIYCKDIPMFLNKDCIFIESKCAFGINNRIEAFKQYKNFYYKPKIIIKDGVSFGNNCHVGAISEVYIGKNTLIGSNVLIIDHNHGYSNDIDTIPINRKLVSRGDIHIGENCWICENVSILNNVCIGNNCIIGANSVLQNIAIPDNSVVVGNPARIVKRINNHE